MHDVSFSATRYRRLVLGVPDEMFATLESVDIPFWSPNSSPMGYELREHTADVIVSATGPDLPSVFETMADGLAAACCESLVDDGDRFSFSITSESRESLLFDYLDELIYLRDVREELPVENTVEITTVDDGYALEASARGIPLEAITAREIKAVTYADMRLEETDDGWEADVVFDV